MIERVLPMIWVVMLGAIITAMGVALTLTVIAGLAFYARWLLTALGMWPW